MKENLYKVILDEKQVFILKRYLPNAQVQIPPKYWQFWLVELKFWQFFLYMLFANLLVNLITTWL